MSLFSPTQLTFLELLDYESEGTPDTQLAFRVPGAILGGMVAVSEGPASTLGSEELNEGENSESPRCRCYKRSDAGGPARSQRRLRRMRMTSADLSSVQLLGHRKTFKIFI